MPKPLTKIIAAALLCVLPTGCAFYSPPQIFPQEQRESLGWIAITVPSQAPVISVDVTTGRGDSAAKSAGIGALSSVYGGFVAGGVGPIFGILLAPAFAVGGAVYGTVAGPSADEVKETLPALEKLLADGEYQKALKLKVLETLATRTAMVGNFENNGETLVSELANAIATPKADTVMEVGLIEIKLLDGGVTNSEVFLAISGFVKLARATDGTVITTSKYLQYSAFHSLEDWGRDGGALVGKELVATIGEMAELMVDNHLLTATQWPDFYPSLQPASFDPEPCLFCDYGPKINADQSMEFCWVSFPAPGDVAYTNGNWLQDAENVVYDFRILRAERHQLIGLNPVIKRYEIDKPCYTLKDKLDPCNRYEWSVRARFRVSGKMYATPWITRHGRNSFKAECH